MPNWINDEDFASATVEEIKPKSGSGKFVGVGAITYWGYFEIPPDRLKGINDLMIERISDIESLEKNWDNEGAEPLSREVADRAKGIVTNLGAIGQEVFNVAPGPNGEILVDVRNKSKSIEFLFYKSKSRVVLFSDDEAPRQEDFQPDNLPTLLKWLNA